MKYVPIVKGAPKPKKYGHLVQRGVSQLRQAARGQGRKGEGGVESTEHHCDDTEAVRAK
jgi:hypothetical protein